MVKRLKNLCHTQLSKLRIGKTGRIVKRNEKAVAAESHAYDATSVPSYAQDPAAESFQNHGLDDPSRPEAIRTFHYSEKDENTSGAAVKSQADIDFYRLDNLEDFAKESTVARETIERWISAGILSPGETIIAEKLIKIMREREHSQNSDHHGSVSGR
jgi:hypothetical protein